MKTQLIIRPNQRAFTMIEIAISIGVIGFALVAIIGILPRGMNTQKDNREDTIVSQDAPYFMNIIRDGEQRTNGGILINYVESIAVTNMATSNGIVYANPNLTPLISETSDPYLTNDRAIIGYLSTPEYDPRYPLGLLGESNSVTAIIRAMSGSALDQNGANAATAFRYRLTVEIAPWNFLATGYPWASSNYQNSMTATLHEIRLRFAWPVLPNGTVGPNRQTYRSLISCHLSTNWPPFFFFQPQQYFTNS